MVFLDNGRTEIAKDPLFSQIFRCVRCGACANVCPVFRLVGGHKMGYIYIGAIGLILTYFFHGKDKAKVLCQNCVGCESCANVCAGGIDLRIGGVALHHGMGAGLVDDARRNELFLLRVLDITQTEQDAAALAGGEGQVDVQCAHRCPAVGNAAGAV